MPDVNGTELVKRASKAFTEKAPLDSLHQEIALNFYSIRADFIGEISLGEEFASHQTDSYPEMVRRDLGNSFASMLRPSDRNWYLPYVDTPTGEMKGITKEWCDYAGQCFARMLADPKARIRRAVMEADNDIASFGQAAMSCTVNRERDALYVKTWHLRDVAWYDDAEGHQSQVFRKHKPTIGQVADQLGTKRFPEAWKQLLSDDSTQKVEIYHVVVKNNDYEPYDRIAKGKPWSSVYLTSDGTILWEAGDSTNQYIIPRWGTRPGSQYAFSPASIIALPQARLIQRMMLTLLESAEKTVDPPMIATMHAIKSEVDLASGGITWIDREYDERRGEALRPLDMGKNINLGLDVLERQRSLLASAFYLDKINLPQSREKTAYETARLVEEYIRNALPLFEPLEEEYNAALLDKVAHRAFEMGTFKREEIPPEVAGKELRFRFSNPLREAIGSRKINAFYESAQMIKVAASLDPTLVAEVDARQMFRDAFGASSNTPANWLHTEDEAAQQKELAQAAQAQQQQMAQIQQVSEIAKNAAPAVGVVGKIAENANQLPVQDQSQIAS